MLFGDSHAIPCCKISVHKLFLRQVLHTLSNLESKANEILHSGILKKPNKLISISR